MLPVPLLEAVGAPIKLLRKRSRTLEKVLKTPLTAADERAIAIACEESGSNRIGDFYYWYYQKLITAHAVRSLDGPKALALISRLDKTDYQHAQAILQKTCGVIVAVPHHHHYILAIIALARHLSAAKDTYIFYGDPKTHPGNEVFDHLSGLVFDQGRVNVIYDNKDGLSKALRCLRKGAVLFILPDVFRDESTTFHIPFYGRAMRVMLGTATLARKTGSVVVPAVAVSSGGMSFRTKFLPEIHVEEQSQERARLSDYKTTRILFHRYEAVMRRDLLCWQNIRQHMLTPPKFDELTADEIDRIIDLLPNDPALLPPLCVVECRRQDMLRSVDES